MNRRQFAFWLGFGLFQLSEKLRADGLDRLAAATMRAAGSGAAKEGPKAGAATAKSKAAAVHWAAGGNGHWRWYERENLIKGEWIATGRTTPVHKDTGARKWEPGGFLDASLLPNELRLADAAYLAALATKTNTADEDHHADAHLPTERRRGRHGRPPSRWLRSLHAYELRTWLKTIDVPEADVSGMTFWTHLTRDHLFDADKIVGLTEREQAKLHAAAHFGY